MEKIRERIFPYLITFTALALSGAAAYVSVIGLSKLFVGVAGMVIIIASILEFSKVVLASLLHRYRKSLAVMMKIYLTAALILLMGITSMGIYGFLSSGYDVTHSQQLVIDKKVGFIENKIKHFENSKQDLVEEKKTIETSISDLQAGLSNNKNQYIDKETGQLVVYSSSKDRKALQEQLQESKDYRDTLTSQINTLNDSIFSNETQILEIESNSELSQELGPLKYISRVTGKSMDSITNILLLILIFVFDPLAIMLVIVSTDRFERLKKKKKPKLEINPNPINDIPYVLPKEFEIYKPQPIIEEEPIEEEIIKEEPIEEEENMIIGEPEPKPEQTIDDIIPENLSNFRKRKLREEIERNRKNKDDDNSIRYM